MNAEKSAAVVVARALDLSPAEVAADGTIENVPGWDSLGHVKVLLALEQNLGRQLAPGEIATIRGVVDIEKILAADSAGR